MYTSFRCVQHWEADELIYTRLSLTIKGNRKEYYRQFKQTNDSRNYGDLTSFVLALLRIVLEAAQDTCDMLEEKVECLQRYDRAAAELPLNEEEQQMVYLLTQIALVTPLGLSFEELRTAAASVGVRAWESHLRALLGRVAPYCIKERVGHGFRYRADLKALE